MRRFFTIFFISSLAFSCGPEPAERAKNRRDNQAEEKNKLSSKKKETANGPPEIGATYKKMKKKEVRELFDRWIVARNEGDLEGYESLYATRFDGIVKKDGRTTRFTRKQWLETRRDLFEKGMKPGVEDLDIFCTSGIAVITFSETATSSREKNRLRKRMIVIEDMGSLKIAKEEIETEMALVKKRREKKPEFLKNFFFVLDNRYVVLENISSKTTRSGALYVNDETAIKPVPDSLMSRRLKWIGKQEMVVGFSDGSTKKVGINGFRTVARYVLHYAMPELWKQEGYSEIQMGEELFELACRKGSVYLVGTMDFQEKKALWAQVYKGTEPEVFRNLKAKPKTKKEMLSRLESISDYSAIQKAFKSRMLRGRWYEYESNIFGRVFKKSNSRKKLSAVYVESGHGCGDFYDSMLGFFIFEKDTALCIGRPADFFVDSFIDDRKPYVAVDIDRDAFPEFAGYRKLMYKKNRRWKVYELKIPFDDSPC